MEHDRTPERYLMMIPIFFFFPWPRLGSKQPDSTISRSEYNFIPRNDLFTTSATTKIAASTSRMTENIKEQYSPDHTDSEKYFDASSVNSRTGIAVQDPALEKTVWRKLDKWILPVVAMFYLLSFLVSEIQVLVLFTIELVVVFYAHRTALTLEMLE
jgi:hypothetical protein